MLQFGQPRGSGLSLNEVGQQEIEQGPIADGKVALRPVQDQPEEAPARRREYGPDLELDAHMTVVVLVEVGASEGVASHDIGR